MKEPDAYRDVPELISALLAEEGATMTTAWSLVCEYVTEEGTSGVGVWTSEDPAWRIRGLIAHAAEILYLSGFEGEYEDED